MKVTPDQRCMASRKDGSPCGGTARPSGYCWNHDPDLEARRRAGNARGGRNRSNAARAQKEVELIEASMTARLHLAPGLYQAFIRVERGELQPSVANSMATVAKALVEVTNAVQVDEQIQELREAIATLAKTSVQLTVELELEERIAALEAAVGQTYAPGNLRRVS